MRQQSNPAWPAESSLRVLVIEDDPDFTRLTETSLARQTTPRFEVRSTGTLAEGLRLLGKAVFDAAVLDLGLPDSRGAGTVEAVRARAPLLPIVVLSATEDADTLHAAMLKGARDFIFKGAAVTQLLPRAILFGVERARTEESLRKSEARYRALFESSRDAIMTLFPPDWKFTSANASTLAMFRAKDQEEFISCGPWEVSPERQPDGELSAEKAKRMIETAMEKGSHFFEWIHTRIGGDSFPATVLLNRVELDGQMGLQATVRDITDQKRVETERERLSTAIEQAAEIVVITNAEALIQYVNPALTRVTGYTREDVLGQNPRLLKSGKHDAAFYRLLWDTLTAGRTWHGRFINRRKDGTLYTEEAAISPVRDAGGAIVSYVAVKRDITRELGLEAQLLQSQKLEAIGTLAGGVAHEINNPVMGIMNYAQLILDRLGPDSPVAEFAAQIGKETDRVSAIVKNLLSFARREKQECSPASVRVIVEGTLLLVQTVMRHDQITLEVDIPEDRPQIRCRSQQVQQVVMNLLTNARDALNQKYPGHDANKKVLITAREIGKDERRPDPLAIRVDREGPWRRAQRRERGRAVDAVSSRPAGRGRGDIERLTHGGMEGPGEVGPGLNAWINAT